MDFLPQLLILSCTVLFFYFWFKPRTQTKSRSQKKEEICEMYRQKLQTELETIDNPDERQKRKIALLKLYAKELEFNLFFDKDDIQTLMRELAGY